MNGPITENKLINGFEKLRAREAGVHKKARELAEWKNKLSPEEIKKFREEVYEVLIEINHLAKREKTLYVFYREMLRRRPNPRLSKREAESIVASLRRKWVEELKRGRGQRLSRDILAGYTNLWCRTSPGVANIWLLVYELKINGIHFPLDLDTYPANPEEELELEELLAIRFDQDDEWGLEPYGYKMPLRAGMGGGEIVN